ncbi:MAG: hypothetical protein HRT73_12980 [Flavobacteriales bacterium]|nr:hypothetical protein [Flavobacteriales bacterium]
MKVRALVVILNILLWQTVYAQKNNDTINIKPVEVIATRIPAAYKTTKFDSSIIPPSLFF